MSGQTLEYLHVSIYASKSIADPLPYFWVWLEQAEPKPRTAPASPAEGLSSVSGRRKQGREQRDLSYLGTNSVLLLALKIKLWPLENCLLERHIQCLFSVL